MKGDRNFDELAGHFASRIYGGPKGQIRLAILQEDLLTRLPPQDSGKSWRILDAGCGQGQLSLWLAGLGHEMVLCDPSAEMLRGAETLFAQQLPQAKVEFIQSDVQNLSARLDGEFDLVLFHAVLEWLAEPQQVFDYLLPFIRPTGLLSLLFYNRNSLVFRNLIRGNFRKVASNDYSGHRGSLTPANPLEPQQVYSWMSEARLNPIVTSGVRVIYDYMIRETAQQRSLQDVLEMERRVCRDETYIPLARYIHVLATRG